MEGNGGTEQRLRNLERMVQSQAELAAALVERVTDLERAGAVAEYRLSDFANSLNGYGQRLTDETSKAVIEVRATKRAFWAAAASLGTTAIAVVGFLADRI